MFQKSIEDRVDSIFKKIKDHSKRMELISIFMEQHSAIEKKVSLYLKLLIFGIVAFEVISKSSSSEITLGFIKLGDLSLMQKFIPVFIAFSYNQLRCAIGYRAVLRAINQKAISIVHPSIGKEDLDYFLQPHS